mmetsp:Transcript_44671/g.100854  ORF Transcript_44671/g.100854 Transcript_44671/m.100854 type:complete len:156 (-) Transcript_44671:263-730(-)
MCREEASKLVSILPQLEVFGAKLAFLLKEDVGDEISAFQAATGAEPGAIYLDESNAFFKALGGGTENSESTLGFLAKYAAGGQMKQNIQRAEAAGFKGNLTGEGLVKGGLYVVGPGGRQEYAFAESEIGDHAPLDAVIGAVARAAKQVTGRAANS